MSRAKRTLADADTNAAAPPTKSAKTTKRGAGKGKENTAGDSKDRESSGDKEVTVNVGEDPFEHVTLCRPFFDFKNENKLKWNGNDDEGAMDSDELRDHYMKESKCGEDGCLCLKPLHDHPDWTWITTRKAYEMHFDLKGGASFRIPDRFDMYLFNDFEVYGLQELIENMLVAFNKEYSKKDSSLNELWAIIEALGYWLVAEDLGPWYMLEDGDRMIETLGLIGCAVLTMLNRLDLAGKLKPDSDFKDISLVMSLFLEFAHDLSDNMDALDDVPWNQHLVSYAKRNKIKLSGMAGVENRVAELEEKMEPDAHFIKGKPGVDQWKNFKDFERTYGGAVVFHKSVTKRGSQLGGEVYNIAKWTSKKRAEYNFDHKDPIPKEIRDALARGEKVMLA